MASTKHPLAQLAKTAVEIYVRENKMIFPPKDTPVRFTRQQAGVFVTITKNGELRGCIGTYAPAQENVALEVVHNAIDAAVNDPRFTPVGISELENLKYEIYILQEPEQVTSFKDLDPGVFGVIVVSAGRKKSGLLLPGLDGITTTEQQLAIACQKANIDPRREKFAVYRFRAEKFF
jgi:AmmeMemoRadiSam system protein A